MKDKAVNKVRWLLLFVSLLCASFVTVSNAGNDLSALAPCLNEQTFAVVHLNTTTFSVDALVDHLLQLIQQHGGTEVLAQTRGDLENFRQRGGGRIKAFGAAGGRDVYAVFNLIDLPHFVIVVPVPEAANAELLRKRIEEATEDFDVGRLQIHATDKLILVGLETSIKLLLNMQPAPCSRLETALQACNKKTLRIALAPSDDQRRILSEMLPALPFMSQDQQTHLLKFGLNWIALGVDTPPTMTVRSVIAMDHTDRARSMLAWLQNLYTALGQEPQLSSRIPQLEAVIQILTPQLEGQYLGLTLDAAMVKQLEKQLVGPWLVEMQQKALRYACGSHVSDIGRAVLIYANDHEDKLPPSLEALVPDYGLSPQHIICPANKTKESYVYRGADLSCADSPTMVVAYDRCENHRTRGGRNVLFLDSRVVWMTESTFQEAIAKDNAYRKKKGLKVLPIQ